MKRSHRPEAVCLMIAALALSVATFPVHASSARGEAPSPPAPKQERWLYLSCPSLETEQVVPPARGDGGGSAEVSLMIESRVLEWSIHYARLSGVPIAVGFFGPAGKGQVGTLQIPIAREKIDAAAVEDTEGHALRGKAVLSPAQMEDLIAGRWYVNVSTSAQPAGEVRAQLLECDRKVSTSFRWFKFWPF